MTVINDGDSAEVVLVALRTYNVVGDVHASRLRLISIVHELIDRGRSGLIGAVSHSFDERRRGDELKALVASFPQSLNLMVLRCEVGHQHVRLTAAGFSFRIFLVLHNSRAPIRASGQGWFFSDRISAPQPKSSMCPWGEISNDYERSA